MIVVGFNVIIPNPKIANKNLTFVGRLPTNSLSFDSQYSNLPINYKDKMRVVEFECRNLSINMNIEYISQYFYHFAKIIILVHMI